MDAVPRSRLARLCWYLDARRWAITVANIGAAALSVLGCIGFFWRSLYVASVVLFLAGSILFLTGALAAALVEYGPCV